MAQGNQAVPREARRAARLKYLVALFQGIAKEIIDAAPEPALQLIGRFPIVIQYGVVLNVFLSKTWLLHRLVGS